MQPVRWGLMALVQAPDSLDGADGGNGNSVTSIGSGAGGLGIRGSCAAAGWKTHDARITHMARDEKKYPTSGCGSVEAAVANIVIPLLDRLADRIW